MTKLWLCFELQLLKIVPLGDACQKICVYLALVKSPVPQMDWSNKYLHELRAN